MVLNLLQISLNFVFAILFLLQGCIQTHAGCPFSRGKRGAESFASEAEIVALLKERFNASIYSKGLDFETRVRDNPTKKNLFGACPSEKCLPSAKFRTFSGYCNNLKSSLSFGGRASRLKRLLSPEYDERSRRQLPNARLVSSVVHGTSKTILDSKHSLMLMQFGQFLDHDLTLTPVLRDQQGYQVDCSRCDADPERCDPIEIPLNDTFFPSHHAKTGQRNCMEFVKSQSVDMFGYRDQLNLVTAWIDGSQIYGSFYCKAFKNLRNHQNGQLDVLQHPLSASMFKPLMPRHATNHECVSKTGLCFSAGDDRSSEQPGLTVQHTLWLRHHNRIAQQLNMINTHWDDERLFQETRKIIIALTQHITFNEFLPRILGENFMGLYNLELEKEDYFYDYDSQCQVNILNEFATSAFRFGHSLIPDQFKLRGGSLASLVNDDLENIQLRRHINNPDLLMSPMFADELVMGMVELPMAKYDRFIVNEVRNHLMENSGLEHSGIDLAAVNIQRGRDHGLRSFVDYESYCSKDILQRLNTNQADSSSQSSYTKIRDWQDLQIRNFDDETVEKLKEVYKNVEDIDFFTGGLSEKSLPDGLVGRTFGCVIATQFEKLRKCDRFWYENYQDHQNIGFSKDQLHAIKNYTMASLLCENLDVPEAMPRWAFDLSHGVMNPKVDCSDHYKLDLSLWREETAGRESVKFCHMDGQIVKAGEEKRVRACTKCYCSGKGGKDGDYCHSPPAVQLGDCRQVINEVGLEAVLADKACKTLCGDKLSDMLKHLK